MNTAARPKLLSFPAFFAGMLWVLSGLSLRGGTISGTLTDSWDGLAPIGVGIGFTIEDLAWDGGGGNEDPDEGDTMWQIQWKIDDGDWGPPNDRGYLYDPTSHLLEPAGDHTVHARARHEAGMDDDGMVIWSDWKVFDDPVKVVGVAALEYWDDGGYVGCPSSPGVLSLGKGYSMLFRALPAGADLFPNGYPVWSGVPPDNHAGATQVSERYDTASTSLSDTRRISVSCGSSSKFVDIVVVEIVRLDWKYQGEPDSAFVQVPVDLDLERGRTAVFWARELAPDGANLPVGGLGWTNAVPDPSDPCRATLVVPAASDAPPDDYTEVGVGP